MATTTIKTVGSLGKQAGKRLGVRLLSEVRNMVGVRAVLNSYYNPRNKDPSPIIFWWFGAVLLASLPTSLYSHFTGQETLPASNFFSALMLLVMVGGLGVIFIIHIALWSHAKYIHSPYKVQSPVIRE